VNVRILSIAILTPLLISGCSVFSWGERVKPIEIQTKAVERTPLNLPEPSPLKGRAVEWIVVTPENVDKVWEQLREKNVDLVLFAITDEGYEQLAVSMAELRNYIAQQRGVIIKYKEYYEPVKNDNNK
jgi:hypothetical protein